MDAKKSSDLDEILSKIQLSDSTPERTVSKSSDDAPLSVEKNRDLDEFVKKMKLSESVTPQHSISRDAPLSGEKESDLDAILTTLKAAHSTPEHAGSTSTSEEKKRKLEATFKGGKGLAFATPKPVKSGSEKLDEILMEPDSTSMDVTDLPQHGKSDKVSAFDGIDDEVFLADSSSNDDDGGGNVLEDMSEEVWNSRHGRVVTHEQASAPEQALSHIEKKKPFREILPALTFGNDLIVILKEDEQMIKEHGRLLKIPAKVTVFQIVQQYLAAENIPDNLRRCALGTLAYFETCIGTSLLYGPERPMFDTLKMELNNHAETKTSKDHINYPYAKRFGLIHLLRLLVTFPEMLENGGLDKRAALMVIPLVQNFVTFLANNYKQFYDKEKDYTP